ncbi:MAG TPA: hypothetical protein VHU81_16195 [Thermoanaerobaculia bacterium]|jgi:hypothetical protein|nr:hypothetical protein [Thermoanaerobaculia bacterium]
MHEGRLHVTPETGTTGTFVPSSTYLDSASLTSSGVSTGLMGAGLVAYIAPGFLASMGLPFGMAEGAAAIGPVCDRPLIIAAFLFSLLGLGLGTLNLVLGLRMRARCHNVSEQGEKVLLAYGDTRKMLVGLGVPLRDKDGPVRFSSLDGTPGGHTHGEGPAPTPVEEHEHGHEEEHEHPRERPNPNNAPAGA